ncbi:MAG: Hint domain-containing protein [Pseudomonadota bacterium]
MSALNLSVGVAYQSTALPAKFREWALNQAAKNQGPGSQTVFNLTDIATSLNTWEVAVHFGVSLDPVGGLDLLPFPDENTTVWDRIKWALTYTPSDYNPLPMLTADPYIAISFGFGIGTGDIGGADVELSLSQGHVDLLNGVSYGAEASAVNTPLFVPNGGGISVPIGNAPGDEGTRFFLLKGLNQVSPSGVAEIEATLILTGDTVQAWMAKFDSDPDAALVEFLQTAGLGAGATEATDNLSILDYLAASEGDAAAQDRITEAARKLNSECFLAGTPISMPDGSTKPIEEIAPGDFILSYDKDGELVSGRVTRSFQNRSKHILDLFGLMTTPGHVTYCADGKFTGRHVPVIDILRSDGALMREDGTKVRAATGCELGADGDDLIWAIAGDKNADGTANAKQRGLIRAGTRFILENGKDFSVLELIEAAGGTITEDGYIQTSEEGDKMPFHWRFTDSLPKPEDYVLQRSQVSLAEIYGADEWEAVAPQMARPAGPSRPTVIAPNIPLSMVGAEDQPAMTTAERRAFEEKQAQKAVSTSLQ